MSQARTLGLTTRNGELWLKSEGGGVHATVAKAPEPDAADSAAHKAHSVQLRQGRVVRVVRADNGRVVRRGRGTCGRWRRLTRRRGAAEYVRVWVRVRVGVRVRVRVGVKVRVWVRVSRITAATRFLRRSPCSVVCVTHPPTACLWVRGLMGKGAWLSLWEITRVLACTT